MNAPPPNRSPSIRTWLTRTLLTGLIVLVTIGSAAAFFLVRHALYAEFDAALLDRAAVLASLVEQEWDGVEFEATDASRSAYSAEAGGAMYSIWLEDGRLLARSPKKGRALLEPPSPGWRSGTSRPVRLSSGRTLRAMMLRTQTRHEKKPKEPAVFVVDEDGRLRRSPARRELRKAQRIAVVVARSSARVDHTLVSLLVVFAFGGLGLLGAGAALIPRAVNAGLRPLDRLAERLTTIEADTLDAALPDAGVAELAPVVATLNTLLCRLQAAFERERRFTAAAAHELRTPIAELRTLSEVALTWVEDRELSVRTLEELVELAVQMERVVGSLLHLARGRNDLPQAAFTEVKLRPLLERAWAPLARGLHFKCDVEEHVALETDPDLFRVVVTNLLENAVEYAPEGSAIRTGFERPGDSGEVVSFSNGIDRPLDSADLTKMFEPFWRHEPASMRGGAHLGLGLSLARTIMEALGGRIDVGTEGRTIEFRVVVPACAERRTEDKSLVPFEPTSAA